MQGNEAGSENFQTRGSTFMIAMSSIFASFFYDQPKWLAC
jgi:hypothetical protein